MQSMRRRSNIRSLHHPAWSFLLLALLCTGCTGNSVEEGLLSAMNDTAPHQLLSSERSIELLEKTELIGGKKWKVSFSCREVAAEPWMVLVNVTEETQTDKNPLDSDFQAALQALRKLRRPERTPLDKLHAEISQFRFPEVVREKYAAGETMTWNCQGVLVKEEDAYSLEVHEITFPDLSQHKMLITQSKVPQDVMTADGSATDPIKQYFALQERLIDGVAKATQAVQRRLEQEQTALQSFAQGGQAYKGNFGNQANQEIYQVVVSSGSDRVNVGLIAESDPFQRAVFAGKPVLPPTDGSSDREARSVHDGWVLPLENADPDLSSLAREMRRGVFVYFDHSRQTLIFSNMSGPVELSSAGVAFEQPRLSVGTVLEGVDLVQGEANRKVRLSVTDFDQSLGKATAVLEDQQNPFNVAVFHGQLKTEAPHDLGIPIQLNRIAVLREWRGERVESPVFNREYSDRLLLVPDGTEWMGQYQGARQKFSEVRQDESIRPARTRWPEAFKPGHEWAGLMRWWDEPVEEVTLRVAEFRDNGGYVRVTVEKKMDPFQFVVYEGAITFGEGQGEGFALTMSQVGHSSYLEHEHDGVIFSTSMAGGKNEFRLSPDGNRLFGTSSRGQTVELKKVAESRPHEQWTSEAMQAAWRKALATGSAWQGELATRDRSQTAEVELIPISFDIESKHVAIEIRLKKMNRIKATYEGTLDVDEGVINGFALKLSSTGGVQTQSILVTDRVGVKLEFRLDPLQERLVARMPHDSRENGFEYLLLERKRPQ